ncbi:hypothetical protein KCP76_13270 [Salmonella enterica subsp. enterica serovar Weltevreden]|nr:hypothetical protein KCP76_13270 [Salmonella enterica subsp. enterica serovar Weltevreden]
MAPTSETSRPYAAGGRMLIDNQILRFRLFQSRTVPESRTPGWSQQNTLRHVYRGRRWSSPWRQSALSEIVLSRIPLIKKRISFRHSTHDHHALRIISCEKHGTLLGGKRVEGLTSCRIYG